MPKSGDALTTRKNRPIRYDCAGNLESVLAVSTLDAKMPRKSSWTSCRPPDDGSKRRHSLRSSATSRVMRRDGSPTILTTHVPLQTRAPADPSLSTRPAKPFVHLYPWQRAWRRYSSCPRLRDLYEMIAGPIGGPVLSIQSPQRGLLILSQSVNQRFAHSLARES
jgi:hypothetical protein